MSIIEKYMGVMEQGKKMGLCELYTQLFFPNHGDSWTNLKWTTRWGITFITMWDNEHLMRNIKFAMVLETLGLGPHRYCIISNLMPEFENKIILLMLFLPRRKMCFYPPRVTLGGPFQQPPWRQKGEIICNRRCNFRSPMLKTLYYTQQFVLFLKTGVYAPSYWM